MKTLRVLLVEDNQGDVFLVEEALRAHNLQFKLDVVADGVDVNRYIERIGAIPDAPCPDVFLLDLNLPKGDGHEILNNFRGNPKCSATPVIIITSSDAPKDRQRAERLGASAYFRKPSDLAEFMQLGAIIRSVVDHRAQ
ncbi:MAG TPA: response regulator [Bryobacteraceae bacterium]|nr:response regulator [Bryobacteraceae bacterium]